MEQTFYDIAHALNWNEVRDFIYSRSEDDVVRALKKERITMEDFAALVSPAASQYLEQMAEKSYHITRRRFGNTMQLYVPMYLSNWCTNRCIYCGFNCRNHFHRTVLNEDQIREEAEVICKDPFQHILLVTGEDPVKADVKYLGRAIQIMKDYFSQVSIEVQPLEQEEYEYLRPLGLHAVAVYQETYNEERYPIYHLSGKKSNYRYRLETPDRVCRAGIAKVGIGNLIGLEDWRTEAYFTALHARYIEKKYWKTKVSISFPRLRPHESEDAFQPNYPTTDREFLQIICSYRLLSEDLELNLSTRESSEYRDKIMPFGVTSVSAGSKTEPGGYAHPNEELEQFAINDDRPPMEVCQAIREKGFDPIWKDWDFFFN